MKDTSWQAWLAEHRAQTSVSLKQLSLVAPNMAPWSYHDDGTYRRKDGLFWAVTGQNVTVEKDGQKVADWSQPLIRTEEPNHGHIILAMVRQSSANNEPSFLLCVDMAPGRQTLELRPTLQASVSKLQKQPDFPRGNLAKLAQSSTVRYDSNVYVDKSCAVGVVTFEKFKDFADECGELRPQERWFTRAELREVVAAGEMTDHLATVIALALL